MARTSSGSSVSAREVKPTRSTKMTVTIRRSSRDGAFAPASGRPHARQNWAIGGFSWQHEAQGVMTRVYGPLAPQAIVIRQRKPRAAPGRHRRQPEPAAGRADQVRDFGRLVRDTLDRLAAVI